jgi:hypothetical protein
MSMNMQKLPSLQEWIRKLQEVAYGEEFEDTLSRVGQWVSGLLSKFGSKFALLKVDRSS